MQPSHVTISYLGNAPVRLLHTTKDEPDTLPGKLSVVGKVDKAGSEPVEPMES